MKILIWISRIFVGGLFVFSGLIKANDSLGFSYKLQEYFEVFAKRTQLLVDTHSTWLPDWLLELLVWKFEVLHDYALPLAMFIVVFEIVLGVLTLTGTKMKFVASSMLAMILFFTFLTFVSWKFKIVTGCGCFGDAIPLTPFQSFIKDLILLVFILILFFYRKSINSLFENSGDKIAIAVSTLCSLLFVIYTYRHLPVKDFRPYAVGNSIKEGLKFVPDESVFFYTMKNKKTGEEKEFSEYPMDSNWTYVSIRTQVTKKGIEPKVKDFVILDEDGNDIMPQIIEDSGYTFLLIMYDLTKLGEFQKEGKVAIGFTPASSTKEHFSQINAFAEKAEKESLKFYGLTASGSDEVASFRHQMQCAFTFYTGDGTNLKTIIRSNPGLVLLHGDKVMGQWHINDFPDFENLMEELNINYTKDL